MDGKRLVWLDSCKGFLILLVIFGHSTHGGLFHINNALASVAMPGFMACSGWLAHQVGGAKILRRFRQLIIPFVLWSLISLVIKGDSISQIGTIFLNPDAYYIWFLWALFWIFCIFNICLWVANKTKINEVICILSIMILLMSIMVILNLRLFGFQFIAYYFIFYSLGYFYRNYRGIQIHNNVLLAVVFCVWAFLAYYWQMHELPYWMPTNTPIPSSVLQYSYRGTTSAIGVILVLALFSKFMNADNCINRALVNIGGISLGLYVVHVIINEKVYNLIMYIFPSINIYALIAIEFSVVFLISYAIVKVLSKFKYTNQYLLGKL